MSYDLALFRLPEGADPAEFFDQLQEAEEQNALDEEAGGSVPLDGSTGERLQKIADSLKSGRPGFEQFEPSSPVPWIELTDEGLLAQVMISERAVHITVPYFRPKAKEMLALVADRIDRLSRDAGFVAFDSQLGRLVTASEMSALETQYREMDQHLWWKFW